jgi:hypothetical protein
MAKERNNFLQCTKTGMFSPQQGCFMKRQKAYKKSQILLLKPLILLMRVFKFLLVILLHILSSGSKAEQRYKPSLQEEMMGENIPFSDQYYIPDDHFRK